jgi:hypothetical protein
VLRSCFDSSATFMEDMLQLLFGNCCVCMCIVGCGGARGPRLAAVPCNLQGCRCIAGALALS